MTYLDNIIHIPLVDTNDKNLGGVERWKAHKEHILHRGFTVCMLYNNSILLQHRKHPAFDGMFDMTFSSHQTVIDGTVQPIEDAITATIKREWVTKTHDMSGLEKKGSFLYQAHDKTGNLYEHEICHFYTVSIKHIPEVNYEYAYGFSVVNISVIQNPKWPGRTLLAPWAKQIIDLYFQK